MNRIKPGFIKFFSFITFISAVTLPITPFAEAETPEKVYSGINNARQIIENINFKDVGSLPANYWAKDAVYETAALEAVKGYGDSNFRPKQALSKEEAIALIYRMLGREADAQKAAEALDAKRGINTKKNDAVKMWADGYLQLALNDGLIKQGDFQTAIQRFQPKPGTKNKFVRTDPAQRQEVAYWVAKAMKLDPVYGQQNIFNSFKDWSKSEPVKVPYIEAILRNNIMNGKAGGYFDPLGSVQREQMARIMKNMEPIVLKTRGYEKKSGYVESIYFDSDPKLGGGTAANRFAIRGEDGKLYNIITQTLLTKANSKGEEYSPGKQTTEELELVVYKDGKLSTAQALQPNDQLDYVVNPDNEVRFVNVRTSALQAKRIKGFVDSVDNAGRTISINNGNGIITYSVSGNAVILDNGKVVMLEDIKKDKAVVITVENDVVTKIDASLQTAGQEVGDVSGIVEENNPELRYISLYEESGARSQDLLRIYNYKPEAVEVTRNGIPAAAKDVQAGDAVCLKSNENNEIILISAVDNYENAYGRIISKQASSVGVEYDDGSQQVLSLDPNVIIISDRKVVPLSDINEGDYVRMLLQKTPDVTKIKEITLKTAAQNISSIYKGEIASADVLTQTIRLKHPEKFNKGRFERISEVGFLNLKADDKIKIFNGLNTLSLEETGKLYINKPVYLAARKDFGGQEAAVMITFKDLSAREAFYDDTIFSATAGAGTIKLDSLTGSLKYDDSTIAVKDGRLTSGRSLTKGDSIYVVTNDADDSKPEEAKILFSVKKQDENPVNIFRGKIGYINTNKNLTLDSYSILDGLTWEFTNSPKTFDISYNTRVFSSEGVDNVRDFVYASNWTGSPVYIVADETEALLISNAPYGAFNARGEVASAGSGSIALVKASLYNANKMQWEAANNITVKILSNTVIIKDNNIIKPEDIKAGDLVRILKKEQTTAGDAYLILVEK
ncbi:MAG: S-layer homology domain-containing protein [Deltaproteobacteria bacterium]